MEEKIRTLIVDDEPLGRQRIQSLLAGERDVEVVEECEDGNQAVAAIRARRPDLVFLDIQMPGMNGLDVVNAVGVEMMPVSIFVTAYDEYALQAFEAHALDYLLKPFEENRFARTLARARTAVRSRKAAGRDLRLEQLLRDLPPRREYPTRFIVRNGTRLNVVDVDAVDWIAAEGNYVRLHTGERSHLLRESMAGMEAQLDPSDFVRIHRSTIVRIRNIASLESVFQGEYLVVLKDETRLTSGPTYREQLERAIEITRE